MRENRYHIINSLVPGLFVVVFLVLFIVSPKQKISTDEKRFLEAEPVLNWTTWTNGSFAKGAENYLADHFAFRKELLAISDFFKNHEGIPRESTEGKFIVIKKKPLTKEPANKKQLNIDSNYTIPLDSAEELVLTNGVFIYDSCSYQFFGGNPISAARYARAYNALVEYLPKNITYYSVLVPSSTEFNLPKAVYRKRANSETKGIADINSRLNTVVKKANVYEHLLAHRKEYLFFKTDHHWTARGAYYAYQAFAEIAGFEALTPEKAPSKIMGSFLGSLYQMTHDPTLKANPDKLEYFDIPFGGAKAYYMFTPADKWKSCEIVYKKAQFGIGYGVFLGIDYPILKIDGPNKNGRKLFILKESYANAFVPFLVPHFEQIFVADVRYFPYKIDRFVADNKINEFLMMNQLVMANSPYTPSKILKLLKTTP